MKVCPAIGPDTTKLTSQGAVVALVFFLTLILYVTNPQRHGSEKCLCIFASARHQKNRSG